MVMNAVTVRVSGLKEVNRYMKKIQTKTPKEGERLTKRIAQFIVRSAKMRVAPEKTGTGDLMRSIEMHRYKNGYVVTAGRGLRRPYAYYQEFGFAPHSVRISALDKRSRIYQELKAGGTRGRIFVRRFTPFMSPAFRKAVSRIGIDLNRTANEIIRG